MTIKILLAVGLLCFTTIISECSKCCDEENLTPLEKLPQCNIENFECISKFLEKAGREYFIAGDASNGLQSLNPLRVNNITFLANNEMYTLQNVNITGFNDIVLKNFYYNISREFMKYDYLMNLNVKAEKLLDSEGQCLQRCNEIVQIDIKNATVTNIDNTAIEQKYGLQFLKKSQFVVHVHYINQENVQFYKPIAYDKNRCNFNQELAYGVVTKANKEIYESWVGILKIVPFSSIFGPLNKDY